MLLGVILASTAVEETALKDSKVSAYSGYCIGVTII